MKEFVRIFFCGSKLASEVQRDRGRLRDAAENCLFAGA
jgi:hypothetical protein